jgi:hypothetical protein
MYPGVRGLVKSAGRKVRVLTIPRALEGRFVLKRFLLPAALLLALAALALGGIAGFPWL